MLCTTKNDYFDERYHSDYRERSEKFANDSRYRKDQIPLNVVHTGMHP